MKNTILRKGCRHTVFTVTLLVLSYCSHSAFADFGVDKFVSDFNGMNGGRGLVFTAELNRLEIYVRPTQGTTVPADGWLDAYDSKTSGAGGSYFKTFCVEPGVAMGPSNYGKLNYDSITKTTSNSSGQAMTLGMAIIYASFAEGKLKGYKYGNNREHSVVDFTDVLHAFLDGSIGNGEKGDIWGNNGNAMVRFLRRTMNDYNLSLAQLKAAYNPNQYYNAIGDYSVFVMQNVEPGKDAKDIQDMIYVMKHRTSDVPEPATLALWGMLGLGIVGYGRFRRR